MKPTAYEKIRVLSFVAVCLMTFAGVAGTSNAQEPLAEGERRGKQIYFQGTSPSGKPVLAYLGESSLEVPASTLTCASCHGMDGQGKPEGGIIPSNITWEALTKPYGVTHASGRKHPPYTNRGIELALTRGVDPAGNKLLVAMPRYSMSRQDMADLILYLGRLGKDTDPGVHETKIVVGTLAPSQGQLAEMGQIIRAVTAGVFADVNAAGGVYNRRLELSLVETAATPAGTLANLERSITAEPIFAMSGAFIAGAEKEVLPFASSKELPIIGPFTLFPRTRAGSNPRVFYLLAGLDDQARAAVEFAAQKPDIKRAGVAVIYREDENTKLVVESIQQQAKSAGLGLDLFTYSAGAFDGAGLTKQVKQAKREAVFLFGAGDEAVSFMQEAEKSGWFPFVFLTSTTGLGQIVNAPAGFDGRIFWSFPTAPADHTPDGIREFQAFSTRHKLPANHKATQLLAYVSARLMVEALKRVGKDLTREKFISALEGLYEYQTGLTPPLTYSPNRRIGAMGAYVITVNLKDKQLVPASGWIQVSQPK